MIKLDFSKYKGVTLLKEWWGVVQEHITMLMDGINEEKAARKAADSGLQTAIGNEVTARQNADNSLQTAISNEASERQNGDKTNAEDIALLRTSISAEVSDRTAADKKLQKQINEIEGHDVVLDLYGKKDITHTGRAWIEFSQDGEMKYPETVYDLEAEFDFSEVFHDWFVAVDETDGKAGAFYGADTDVTWTATAGEGTFYIRFCLDENNNTAYISLSNTSIGGNDCTYENGVWIFEWGYFTVEYGIEEGGFYRVNVSDYDTWGSSPYNRTATYQGLPTIAQLKNYDNFLDAVNGIQKDFAPATATYVIAAANSVHKENADYICDGVDDQEEINAAIAALPDTGGKVQLLDGTFYITSPITIKTYTWLDGMGMSTRISGQKAVSDINGIISSGFAAGFSITNMYLLKVDSGINITNGSFGLIENVAVESPKTNGITLFMSYGMTVRNCLIGKSGNAGIRIASFAGAASLTSVVTGNRCMSGGDGVYFQNCSGVICTDNILSGNTGGAVRTDGECDITLGNNITE